MSIAVHLTALFCVVLIAAGQLLFKQTAGLLATSGTFADRGVILVLGTAFALYAAATLIWVVLLQHAPLSRLYLYMALSFVLVPLAGSLVFGETLGLRQAAGIGLIVCGVLLSAA